MFSPSSSRVPSSARLKPVTASISVVLPAPFGPISPSTRPGRSVAENCSTATVPPYFTVMPRISSTRSGTCFVVDSAGNAIGFGGRGARNGNLPASFERAQPTWAIHSLTRPFWFRTTSTITEMPPISTMYLPVPSLIESKTSPHNAPGASAPPAIGPKR